MKSIARMIGTLLTGAVLACAQTGAQPEVALRAAMELETVKGDLRGAIQRYARLAEGQDRAVAATALVRMAQCHEKLGNAEARKIYERVIRDYGDQKEAVAMARSRLGRDAATRTTRHLWTLPPKGEIYGGTVSGDGRYVAYVDWAQEHHGDLFLHNLTTGADRRLTNTAGPGSPSPEDQFAEEYSISRDGKQLAYTWFDGKKDRYELRIIDLQGTGIPQFQRLFDNEDIFWIAPHDWSPDAKSLAVSLHRRDRNAQIGLVTIPEGSLRVLKSVDWRGPSKMFFSADGKYLAYDIPARETSLQRDIFLLAIDGSSEVPAVAHPANDELMGWSPDGKRLLFSSDRTGSTGLWTATFKDGKPQGGPELVKRDIGELYSLGVTTSGALYSTTLNLSGSDIQMAPFDFNTGQFLSPPAPAVQTFVGRNQSPDWSPDGKYLAYVSQRGAVGRSSFPIVGIRAVETGEVRDLSPLLQRLAGGFRWTPDGSSFLAAGRDLKGRGGIFRIDARSGETSIVVHRDRGGVGGPVLSPDEKTLYYRTYVGGEFAFVRRDLGTGNETELIRRPRLGTLNLAPDGRAIATFSFDPSAKSASLLLISIPGGEPRELMRVNEPAGIQMWAPDSRAIFIKRSPSDGRPALWRAPLDGTQPKKLDANLDPNIGQFRLHPDGRQVTFEVRVQHRQGVEVWALENFLPDLSRKK
jgi:Tol biopolymer transport system component